MNCGREPEGKNAETLGICPAATAQNYNSLNRGTNGGRFCWRTAGTLCFETIQGIIAQHIESCSDCSFYQKVKEEEGGFLHDPLY